MTKRKTALTKKTPPAKQDKQADSKLFAKLSLSPETMSAVLSDAFTNEIFPDMNLKDVSDNLCEKITIIQNGDMKSIEAMLIGQAQALQTMFVALGRQAAKKSELNQYTAFMNLALKAQSQSRSTIQALIELKYPKQATFVKQANIAGGNQQVNNGNLDSDTHTHAHVKENLNSQNKLLEVEPNEWLDNGEATTPSKVNQTLAALET